MRAWSCAPVALFAYDRPHHLRSTVAALAANDLAGETDLFLFLDGPKGEADGASVDEVRHYAASIKGFRSVSLCEHKENLGLAASIIGGVSRMLEKHGSVIVLEDDIVTSPFFLRYMNDALEVYRQDESVASIHGFVFEIAGLPETFFLRGADCWGWATWRRAWRVFDQDGSRLLGLLEQGSLPYEFDLDGSVSYTQMLRDQIAGRNDSWAVRWHAATFLKGMLTLHPGRSLIRNIGLDGSGTHCHDVPAHLSVEAGNGPVHVNRIPLEENPIARARVIDFLRAQAPATDVKKGFLARVAHYLRSRLQFK